MRLILALWPDDKVRLALAAQRLEIARVTGGRPTMPVTMHMTLVFAGNVPASRLLELKMAIAQVRARPFTYVIDTAGCFDSAGVAWLAGAAPPKKLFDLQSTLYHTVANADFDVDARRFRPHITITRHIEHSFAQHAITPTPWRVDQFSLIQAIRDGASIRYETLETWPLTG